MRALQLHLFRGRLALAVVEELAPVGEEGATNGATDNPLLRVRPEVRPELEQRNRVDRGKLTMIKTKG